MRHGHARQAPEPSPEPARDLAAECAGVMAQARALLSALEGEPCSERLIIELIGTELHVSDLRSALDRHAAALREQDYAIDQAYRAGIAAERARWAKVPAPRPGRHASAGWRASPIMVRVKAAVPLAAGGSWAALREVLKRGAHHPLIAAMGAHKAATAAGAMAAVAFTAAVALPNAAPLPRTYTQSPGAIPAPAATAYAAAPIPAPASSPPADPDTPGRADARNSGRLPALLPPSWYATPPSPSAAPSPAAPALSADVTSADLSSGQQVTVTLTATGGSIGWHAWCRPSADVILSAAVGTAVPGQPSLLVLTPAAFQDGAATAVCGVWPGDITIQVTLPAPAPSPAASPAVTPAPTDSPSPSGMDLPAAGDLPCARGV